MVENKRTEQEIAQEKANRVMQGVAKWASFYRANPQRFVKDYLNVELKMFQQQLIYEMMHNNYIMYIAARGQGKTYLTALFCVVRCILYPKTKICVASATRSQGNEVLLKIVDDFCKNYQWGSANLNNEISEKTVGVNKAVIEFKNGSWIKVVTASDNARGSRANILIIDEFRMVDLDTIDTVLKRFLTAPRQPLYLNNPKYKDMLERNKEIYMSSAWLKSHWSYEKAKSYTVNFLDDTKKYFICALPYQLSIKEGLLSKEQIQDEMSEAIFDATKFSMEMEAIWLGDTEGSFFQFDNIDACRRLRTCVYPTSKIPELIQDERRILSLDIALMASEKDKNNDASSVFINSAIPNNKAYTSNVIYTDNFEGLTTNDLALKIRRLFHIFKCTDLVMDTAGQGLGVYDELIKDIIDPETGERYPALSCCNDEKMAVRCKVENAPKVIWSIKASESFNTEVCTLLRGGFAARKINLLVNEYEADAILKKTYKGFDKLPLEEQSRLKLPYIHTTLLIYELINLQYERKSNNNIKIYEKRSMRKDRYSSLGYNYWVQHQLEVNELQKDTGEFDAKSYAEKLRKLQRKPTSY